MKKAEMDAEHIANWILGDKTNTLYDLANLMGMMSFEKREKVFDAVIQATIFERNQVKGDGWIWLI